MKQAKTEFPLSFLNMRKETEKEGYVKFEAHWVKEDCVSSEDITELNRFRSILHKLGLVGVNERGEGFGNLSKRHGRGFIISGTCTGEPEVLFPGQYAFVSDFDFDANFLECRGLTQASSESLSHAAIYSEAPWADFVAHIHHLEFWERARSHLPSTPETAEYGTPELAYAIMDLIAKSHSAKSQCIVMAGHREGLIFYADTLLSLRTLMLSSFKEYIGWDYRCWGDNNE